MPNPTLDSLSFNPADPDPGQPTECIMRLKGGPTSTKRTVAITFEERPNNTDPNPEALIRSCPTSIDIPVGATGVVFAVETLEGTSGGFVTFTAANGALGSVSEDIEIHDPANSGQVDSKSIPLTITATGVEGNTLTTTNDTVHITVQIPPPPTPGDQEFARLLEADKPIRITYGQFKQVDATGALAEANVLTKDVENLKPQRIEKNRLAVTFPIRVKPSLAPGVYYVSVGVALLQGNPPYKNALLVRFEKLPPGEEE